VTWGDAGPLTPDRSSVGHTLVSRFLTSFLSGMRMAFQLALVRRVVLRGRIPGSSGPTWLNGAFDSSGHAIVSSRGNPRI
jgi:hypothetical protein